MVLGSLTFSEDRLRGRRRAGRVRSSVGAGRGLRPQEHPPATGAAVAEKPLLKKVMEIMKMSLYFIFLWMIMYV